MAVPQGSRPVRRRQYQVFRRDPNCSTRLRLFCIFNRTIPFFDSGLLAHVLALLGSAVPFGAFSVINMALGVHPDHPRSTAGSVRSHGFRGFRRFRADC